MNAHSLEIQNQDDKTVHCCLVFSGPQAYVSL